MKSFEHWALRPVSAAALLLTSSMGAAAESNVDVLLDQLSGTWIGSGHVVFENGERWGLHCPKMVWARAGKSTKIKSTIVCSTHPQQGYKMNLTAGFNVTASGNLSGAWSEKNYAVQGSHKGSFSSKGAKNFNVQGTLVGDGVTGRWSASISGCALTLTANPKNVIATSMKSKFRKRGC